MLQSLHRADRRLHLHDNVARRSRVSAGLPQYRHTRQRSWMQVLHIWRSREVLSPTRQRHSWRYHDDTVALDAHHLDRMLDVLLAKRARGL